MSVTEEVLKEGIEYCKIGEPTPEKMVRLAAYMTVRDHLFGEPMQSYSRDPAPEQAETIYTIGKSEFLRMVDGKDTYDIMDIMDELMETMKVIQPRIYDSVMRKVSEIK